MEQDFNYYKKIIEKYQLPDDLGQWLMTNEEGNTLAHIAAKKGILPPDWTDKTEHWLIKDALKTTIAHNAAINGTLPINWTNDPQDWMIFDISNSSIGLNFSYNKKEHYNSPENLIEYAENIKNHLYPFLDHTLTVMIDLQVLKAFINPFFREIKDTNIDGWLETSDEYSGFLIDYIESIVETIKEDLKFEGKEKIPAFFHKKITNEIDDTIDYIKQEKIVIKERLFNQYATKKNDNNDLCFNKQEFT